MLRRLHDWAAVCRLGEVTSRREKRGRNLVINLTNGRAADDYGGYRPGIGSIPANIQDANIPDANTSRNLRPLFMSPIVVNEGLSHPTVGGGERDDQTLALILHSLNQCFSKWSVPPPGGVEEMQGGDRRVRLEWGAYITV
ncbi:hypothetical protein FHG87_022616 [Trinorchestia longiramus]|nr:hypothetical protein FHG87_022616 [Trinorchestia longiramus]